MKKITLFTKLVLILVLMASVMVPTDGFASTKEDLKLKYSEGYNPSVVVLDNGFILALKEKDDKLYYQLGEYVRRGIDIEWSEPIEYDTGNAPNLTVLDNGHVMEVHNGATDDHVYYSLGRYKDGEMDWYNVGNKYNTSKEAKNPSVTTLENGQILAVNEDPEQNKGGWVRYYLGNYDEEEKEIQWKTKDYPYAPTAYNPSISVLDNGSILHVWDSKNAVNAPLSNSLSSLTQEEEHPLRWVGAELDATGYNPSVTNLANGDILNVYENENKDGLSYSLGRSVDDREIDWYSTDNEYDVGGINPSAAVLVNGLVLSVHEAEGDLYFKLGEYNEDEIEWLKLRHDTTDRLLNSEMSSLPGYANGENPAITVLDNELVVSVNDKDGKLSYQLGEYHDGQVYWTDPVEYGDGEKPTLATLANGDIIEVHEGGNHELHYNLGRYDPYGEEEIDWYSTDNFYGIGDLPNVDVMINGDIVLVNEGQTIDDIGVYYEYGTFENEKVTWYRNGVHYENGLQPSITALDNGRLLKTQKSVSDNHLWLSMNQSSKDNHSIDVIGESYEYEAHSSNHPVMLQLENGYILSMFDSNQSDGTWNRVGKLSSDGQEIEWTSNTYHQFDGKNNDVVQLQNGRLLNVHEDHESDEIQYKLGSFDDRAKQVNWSDDYVPLEYLDYTKVSTEAVYNEEGGNPSITVLDNGLVLSVNHSSSIGYVDGKLNYQLGEEYDGVIYWTDPVNYDNGNAPSVATLPNGDVIEVHGMGGYGTNLYYNVGRYEDGKINWYILGYKYDTGQNPNITVTKEGQIVEVHEALWSNKIFYNYGTFKETDLGSGVFWDAIGQHYDSGHDPSVAALDNGLLLKTHRSSKLFNNNLWLSLNGIDKNDKKINTIGTSSVWKHSGRLPVSYQLDNGQILMMFNDGFNMAELSTDGNNIEVKEDTFTEFCGEGHDVVQLQNGLILNVHEDNKKLRYVLGEYDEKEKRVVWFPKR
ncbi:hypothetical protein [Jeotgalibacillus marinus]|uniref:Uncharacterized protein n=1 Tax=Jeotgalibacillus marinus TaxID=86667 RepID=A0ABV3Q5C6_9BACL